MSGPRSSTKTVSALHAIADNLWSVDGANFTMVVPTVTAGDDQGCWTQITEEIIPEWIAGGFGLEWVRKPSQSGVSKKLYCVVKNKFGTNSRLQLDSLQYEDEVEARFKNKNYSGLYISEASYYKQRRTFDVWQEVLRGKQYKEEDFLMLLDTNPADEGTDSWLYQMWWVDRLADFGDDKGKALFQKQLALMEFSVADNIFKDEAWHMVQKAKYQHSQDLYDRYYLGKWVKATDNSIFYEQLNPSVHFVGDSPSASEILPQILLPQENCFELGTGWDPGLTNSAAIIYEKSYFLDARERKVSRFSILDETVFIKSDASINDFTDEVMERIKWWEGFMGRDIVWRHFSDRSVFDTRIIGNVYPHQLIYQQSGGKISLQAVERKPGSVYQRIDLVRKLLFDNRLFISKHKCPHLMESLQGLQPGKGNVAIQKTSKLKHVFDAMSYALISECFDELYQPTEASNVGSGVITVPL